MSILDGNSNYENGLPTKDYALSMLKRFCHAHLLNGLEQSLQDINDALFAIKTVGGEDCPEFKEGINYIASIPEKLNKAAAESLPMPNCEGDEVYLLDVLGRVEAAMAADDLIMAHYWTKMMKITGGEECPEVKAALKTIRWGER